MLTRLLWALATSLGATALSAAPLAVYQSEANFAEYQGVHQQALRQWLSDRGQAFAVIGDAQAADVARLAPYPLVLASSSYIVPPGAMRGLSAYVQAGGQVLWFDSPARVGDPEFRSLLGLGTQTTYLTSTDCRLRSTAATHPLASTPQELSPASFVGNCATSAAEGALVLYEAVVTPTGGGEQRLPAVVLAKSGSGVCVTFNWLPWLSPSDGLRDLLSQSLDYLLARWELQQTDLVARCRTGRVDIRQPEPVQVTCAVFARRAAADTPATAGLRLADADGRPIGQPLHVEAQWQASDDELSHARLSAQVPTAGLADGHYTVSAEVHLGASTRTASAPVRLSGQQWARLQDENRQRRELLRPLLVGALGDYDAEPRTAEGRVDLPRLLRQIETAHMNMYDFLIWHAATDWEDFQAFLPMAQEKSLKVWVTLCPPSEQGGNWPYSEPYRLDFVKWAEEIGALADQYPCLVAMVIDDFWSGDNRLLYTPEYIARMVATLRAQCPTVAFLPTIYKSTVGDAEWVRNYGPYIDGIVFPYEELQTGEHLREQLAACRDWLGPDKLILVNIYASGSSGPQEPGPRTEAYMRQTLTLSRELADGIRIYCLPKGTLLEDHRYRVTAELYGEWSGE